MNSEPSMWFADDLLYRLAYLPETCPPGLSISSNYGADGHGGPGHQDASDAICGTLLGMVCFFGSIVHVGDAVYRVGRYDRKRKEWEAYWPD